MLRQVQCRDEGRLFTGWWIPYRSVIVKDTRYDDKEYFDSCIMIQNSIETYHRIMKGKPVAVWPERMLDDFQDADLSLFDGAYRNLNS